jgi:hypothetical protein
MIETTTKLTSTLHSKNGFHIALPESVVFDLKYYIKILITTLNREEHIDSIVEIKEVFDDKATFYKKNFIMN